MSSQEVTEGVDRQVQLGAFLALGAIIAGPGATLGRGAQRAAVEHGGGGLLAASGGQAQHGAQIMGQFLEAAGVEPALRLLVDGRPGWQVVGHPAPGRPRLDDVAQAVEHLAQGVFALVRLFRQERQIGCDQRPFFVRDIGGVGFASRGHSAPTAMTST